MPKNAVAPRLCTRLAGGRAAGVVLTCVSGWVNAHTLTRFGTVGGPMTGNTIKVGVNLALGEWEAASALGAMLLGFYLGGFVVLALLDLGRHVRGLTVVGPSLLLGGALLLCDALAPIQSGENAMRLVSALTAFSLGGQNVVSAKAPSLGANTTFMTGTLKRISEGSYALVRGTLGRSRDRDTLVLLLLLWAGTLTGAAIGILATSSAATDALPLLARWPLLAPAILQAVVLWLLRWKDPEPPPPTAHTLGAVTPGPPTPAGSISRSPRNSRSSSPAGSRPPGAGSSASSMVSSRAWQNNNSSATRVRHAAAQQAATALTAGLTMPRSQPAVRRASAPRMPRTPRASRDDKASRDDVLALPVAHMETRVEDLEELALGVMCEHDAMASDHASDTPRVG